jgi:cation diffusion facilitator CzcD-associated flavoprotein CzcO
VTSNHYDVLIVGAGISGIAAAHHLAARCPKKTYAILEGRETLGGTWDLFRYPGVRSDSDMYTLGFSFRPWTDAKTIANRKTILSYVRDTVSEHGIDRHIRYRSLVRSAEWSSEAARWTVKVEDTASGDVHFMTCRFLSVCAGYYDYEGGFTPDFEDAERFRGRVVHPQHWPEELDYSGKRIVVIGSGATAVTLVPELAKRAAQVTMLQRSPTYILASPSEDSIATGLRRRLPDGVSHAITRWKNVAFMVLLFHFCRRYPEIAKRHFIGQARAALGEGFDIATHFTPSYMPWDQRLCLVPDGDLFAALREGKAVVVTDHVERFTENGIRLRSGAELEADIIVTATGLRMRFLGGMELSVDGRRVEPSETMAYKGMMMSGVPNLSFAIGYTNASWTLKCELTAEFVCRVLQHMDANGYTTACPGMPDPAVDASALIDFSSGYVKRGIDAFPRQGSVRPWRLLQNYALDLLALRHKSVEDGILRFSRPSKKTAASAARVQV